LALRCLSRCECIRRQLSDRYTDAVSIRQTATRATIVILVLLTSVMWIYAFVFSSREAVNKIEDSGWQQRAQMICGRANVERTALADYRLIEDAGEGALTTRAEIVDKANQILAAMIDSIEATPPLDDKGLALVPQWIKDYRTYIQDRYAYTAELRSGINDPFSETMADGLPLSEKISTFAADNEMPACKAPIDLSV
jgi:hypothetical protein